MKKTSPQKMGCWTDKNTEPHISVNDVLSWRSRLTRASWIYHLHQTIITGHLSPNKFHADTTLHECTFSGNHPTHQVYFNLPIDVQHLPRRYYVNNSHIYWALTIPSTALQGLYVSWQLILTTTLGVICNYYPHLIDEKKESGRPAQGHTVQQGCKSRQNTLCSTIDAHNRLALKVAPTENWIHSQMPGFFPK